MIGDLKPYARYKESGLPWLGQIPEHWSQERAKWLFTKMDRPVTDDDEVVTCFRDGTVTLRKNRRLRGFTEAIYELGYQGIRKGDLVIHAMDAFAGAVGVSDSNGKGTPVYAVCQPRTGINARYYAFIVREMARSNWILALSRGIRERSTDFRFDAFGAQTLAVPPSEEQSAIVRFLDWANGRLDRAIRAKRKVIALLNEQKQAIIHRAVTRGLDPSVPLKPSGLSSVAEIPAHWDVRQLGRFIVLQRGFDITKEQQEPGNIPVVSSGGVSSYHTVAMASGPGVVVGRKGSVGSVHFIDGPYWPHDTTLFVKDFGSNVPRFVYFVLDRLELKSFDTGSSNPTLNRNVLHPELVAFPPPAEQAAIANAIDEYCLRVNTRIDALRREVELVQEYRSRVIADVVTGKVDVRETATRLPDEAFLTPIADDAISRDEIDRADAETAA